MRRTFFIPCLFSLIFLAMGLPTVAFAMPSDDEGEDVAIKTGVAERARHKAGGGGGGSGGSDAGAVAEASGTSPSSADAGAEDAATDAASSAAPSTSSKPQLMDLPVDVLHYVMEFSENEKNFSMANKAAAAAYRDYLKSLKHGLIPTPLADDIRHAPVARYRLMDVETRHKLKRALPEDQIKAAIRRSCHDLKCVIVDARCAMLGTLESALDGLPDGPSDYQSMSRLMVNREDTPLLKAAKACIYEHMVLILNQYYMGDWHKVSEATGGGGFGGAAAAAASGSYSSSGVAAAVADEKSDATPTGPNAETVKAAIRKEFDEKSALKKFVAWQDALGAWRASDGAEIGAAAGGGGSSAAEDAGGGRSDEDEDADAEAAPSPTQPNFVWIPQEELESLTEANRKALENYFRANPTHTLVVDMVGLTWERAREEVGEFPGQGKMPTSFLPTTLRHVTFTNTRRDIVELMDIHNQQPYIETIHLKGFEKVRYLSFAFSSYTALKTLSLGFLPNLHSICGPSDCSALRSLDLRTLYAASTIVGFNRLRVLTNLRFPDKSNAKKVNAFHDLPALAAVDLRGFWDLNRISTTFLEYCKPGLGPLIDVCHMFEGCKNLGDVTWMDSFREQMLRPGSFEGAPVLESMDDKTKALLDGAIERGRIAGWVP